MLLRFSVVIYSWKCFENKNTVVEWFFWVISSYFFTRIFCSYIFTKTFWKTYENKNIVFCYTDFCSYIFTRSLLKNLWKQKYCIFVGISSYFVTRITYIFTNIFFNNLWEQILYLKNLSGILKTIMSSNSSDSNNIYSSHFKAYFEAYNFFCIYKNG